jgi:hypothetical protein
VTDLGALKAALPDIIGIESLTETIIGGRKVYGFNGLIAAVDMNADEAAIESAIRSAAALRPVTSQPKGNTMSVTGASHAGMTLKQMMSQRKQAMTDAHDKLKAGFAKLDQATAALDSVGDKVAAEADDLLATVGQFTNDLG